MDTALINLAYSFLSLVIPVIAVMVVELIRRYLGLQKMAQVNEAITNKKALALIAVRFAEQTYQDLHGEEKFNKAASWLAEQVDQYGFNVSETEIKGLIEAALRQLKDEFASEWHKQLQ
ncbi:MAG TPA: phage holin [Syntrophomonas sp.]|jgi:LL-H family phage holin|nr:phage holin [Syntrophomonas sp.]